MKLFEDISQDKINKPAVEQIVKEKVEFNILGTYSLTRGLTLFNYNPKTDEINIQSIKRGDFIQCVLTTEGWIWFDPENYNTTIDGRLYYFEALNRKSAKVRVDKFKQGKIKELFNLRKPNPEGIKFY